MSQSPTPRDDEARAAERVMLMGVARIAGLALALLGIAIAQAAIEAPYWLGVVIAFAGLLTFFFAPTMLAKRWKAADRAQDEGTRGE